MPAHGEQMGEPLTPEGRCALRYELGNLMMIARISRPDALYDASISGQTFAVEDHAIQNPIDFDEFTDVNI